MLNYEYPPLGGGAGLVCKSLAENLSDMGIQIDLVTMHMKGLKREESHGNIRIFRVPSIRRRKDVCDFSEMSSYIPNALYKSLKLMKKERYSLNHTHFIIPTGIVSLALKKVSRLPYIITVHGSDVPGHNPDRFASLHLIVRDFWREIIRNSANIVLLSEKIKKTLMSHINLESWKIIPNALPRDRFNVQDKKKKNILVVSRLLRFKGIQYLLEALSDSDFDLHVDIVGEGPFRTELESIIKDTMLDVTFHGWLDNADPMLTALYQTSEFFIFPSESENFPMVLLEAMASGATIITTGNSGCEYVVGDSGILIPSRSPDAIRSALQYLLINPSKSETWGKKARQRFEKYFTWEKVAKQYIEVYSAALAEN